jgi:hypothetical protein
LSFLLHGGPAAACEDHGRTTRGEHCSSVRAHILEDAITRASRGPNLRHFLDCIGFWREGSRMKVRRQNEACP